MVIKVKVSDVAKDFGKTNKEIIEILDYHLRLIIKHCRECGIVTH